MTIILLALSGDVSSNWMAVLCAVKAEEKAL